ncbi:hypothetical protein LCGC14_0204540 [marine sediment metagenome]|uniref:Glycosyltransferase RgtA/B/C/D-like domain-containing protein n=1 Tax=marine sediment metagenome TaxID=412755 RepID=A0A0F9X1M5_9ZZZZ|nr:hypothetical protein [Phycisphaerae bacterium]
MQDDHQVDRQHAQNALSVDGVGLATGQATRPGKSVGVNVGGRYNPVMDAPNSLTTLRPGDTTAGMPLQVRLSVCAALAAAMTFAGLLGIRTLTSTDLGYHLAYGEQLLRTGKIVDHDSSLYTLPDKDLPAERRPEPGPGNWYDSEGRYRFPNANWLSQFVMFIAYAKGGLMGLCILSATISAAMFAVLLAAMRRLDASWLATAAALLLVACVLYPRLNLRPELFGYLMLGIQLCLLAPSIRGGPRAQPLTKRVIIPLVVLQLLFVNLHSYFLLGLALTGAVFVEQMACWAWWRFRRRTKGMKLAKGLRRIGFLLGCQFAICFVNPWTWRLVLLPVETAVYLRRHRIAAGSGDHPWSTIIELLSPLSYNHFPTLVRDYAMCVVLAMVAMALVVAIIRGRVGLAGLLGMMTWVGLSMSRNMAVAACVLVPVSLTCLWPSVARFGKRLSGRTHRALRMVLGAALMGVSIFGVSEVVTNRSYFRENFGMRFGLGISRVNLPVGAVAWLDVNLPGERVWCDFSTSSYVHFFSSPHRAVSIVTNTWAYPPDVMRHVQTYGLAERPMNELSDQYEFAAIVLRSDWTTPLFHQLTVSPQWRLVHLEGKHVVFLRARGRYRERALSAERRLRDAIESDYVEHVRRLDPVSAFALLSEARVFSRLGWHDQAVVLAGAAAEDRPKCPATWNGLGSAYFARSMTGQVVGDVNWREDLVTAEKCFRMALQLRSSHRPARRNLQRVTGMWEGF